MAIGLDIKKGALDPRNWADGSSRRWSPAWTAEEEADPTLPDVHWLLDLQLGAVRVKASTGPIDLYSAAGTTMSFTPALVDDIEIEDAYTPGESAGARSVGAAVANRLVAAASQVAAGYVLAGEVEISLAAAGMSYEDRYVLLDGDVNGGVSFGTTAGGAVRFTAADPRDTAGLPVTPYLIETSRFAAATTQVYGQRFPYIFNQYERVTGYLVAYGTGSATALVCVPAAGLDIPTVYINGESELSSDPEWGWEVLIKKDTQGQAYLAIDFTGTHDWTGDEDVTCDVTSGADTYLHEAIRVMCEGLTDLGRRRIHYDLIGELPARIGSVETRLYVNGSGAASYTTAMDAIESALLASFPMVSMVTTDGRYGPVVTDARSPARAELTRGIHLLNRESDVEESDKRKLLNHFTFLYRYNLDTDLYEGLATRSPENSVLCSRSLAVVGPRHREPIESTEIFSDEVAEFVVDWMVYHLSMPSYYVEYTIPLAYLLRLRLGWNVNVTDSELGWSSVRATVTKRLIRRHVGVVGLRIYWPNLAGVGVGGGASGSSGGGGGQ